MNNLLLNLIGVYSTFATFPVERPCGSNIKNLWLDVVLVVDDSKGMTNVGLEAIASNLTSIFSPAHIGTNPSNPKTTRIGIVTYNSNATLRASFITPRPKENGMLNFYAEMSRISETSTSFVKYGLQMARDLLYPESFNPERSHYKKVIIVYASTYKGTGNDDPVPVADRLKASGVKILTIAYDQGDEEVVEELAKISSPGLSFNKATSVQQIQEALLEVNCFCPSSNWYQYRTPSQSYGTCIQPVGILSGWSDARVFCKNHWNNSYLASEFTPEKHQFIFDTVQKIPQISEPYSYHIGLKIIDGEWFWDQPSGPILVRNYENWEYNYPSQYDKLSVGMNFENSEKAIRWINVAPNFLSNYVCETPTCDTDNYCDASVFEH